MRVKAACLAVKRSTSLRPPLRQHAAQGMDVHGPFAPDTVFMRARATPGHPGEFDVVVAMYHDQGLIPVKYLGVEQGVNVTLGLPLVRTSPDHGTAFDIAGTGRADPSSLIAGHPHGASAEGMKKPASLRGAGQTDDKAGSRRELLPEAVADFPQQQHVFRRRGRCGGRSFLFQSVDLFDHHENDECKDCKLTATVMKLP